MAIRAISFGGGVQSTALMILAAERKIDFPYLIFANTGNDSESAHTLDYLEAVTKPYAKQHGLEFMEVRNAEPQKISFKYRHPKIYKQFRKVRAVCIFIGPVVNVGANIATAIGVIF